MPAADMEVLPLEVLALAAVPQAAEEQRSVRDILQRFGPAPQVGLEVFQAQGGRGRDLWIDGEHVLAHEAQELAGLGEVGALGANDRIFGVVFFLSVRRHGSFLPGDDPRTPMRTRSREPAIL
jgi:hypothetical protein